MYTRSNSKIKILCKEHGVFEQVPGSHLTGAGCRTCGIIRTASAKYKTTEQFIDEAKVKHGDTYDYSKVVYIKSKKKVTIICKEHGEFEQSPTLHLTGGCEQCGIIRAANAKYKTTEQYIEQAKKVHGDKYDYTKSVYIGYHSKLKLDVKSMENLNKQQVIISTSARNSVVKYVEK